jgi:hypothetical protein
MKVHVGLKLTSQHGGQWRVKWVERDIFSADIEVMPTIPYVVESMERASYEVGSNMRFDGDGKHMVGTGIVLQFIVPPVVDMREKLRLTQLELLNKNDELADADELILAQEQIIQRLAQKCVELEKAGVAANNEIITLRLRTMGLDQKVQWQWSQLNPTSEPTLFNLSRTIS